jgi:hypothetical protein
MLAATAHPLADPTACTQQRDLTRAVCLLLLLLPADDVVVTMVTVVLLLLAQVGSLARAQRYALVRGWRERGSFSACVGCNVQPPPPAVVACVCMTACAPQTPLTPPPQHFHTRPPATAQ